MKKFLSTLLALAVILSIAGVSPLAAASTSGPIIIHDWRGQDHIDWDELVRLNHPPPSALFPAPGVLATNREPKTITGGHSYGAFITPLRKDLTINSHECIIVGSLAEFYGESVLWYEDGHRVYPTREIFSDGERLTFFPDQSRLHLESELYIVFRYTDSHSDSQVIEFSDNRGNNMINVRSNGGTAGIFPPTRPIGGGSIQDVITGWDINTTFSRLGDVRTIPVSTNPQNNPQPPIDPNQQPSTWAQDSVGRAGDLGLLPAPFLSGYRNTTTRAEFTALAVLFYEYVTGAPITGRQQFSDTNDINVEKAAYARIVSGVGNNRFNPNGLLTRQEAATILARMGRLLGKPLPQQEPTFADSDLIAPFARVAVGQMQATRIMTGSGGRFDPRGSYTREQSIATIIRMLDYLEE